MVADVVDYAFTARMEDELDDIAAGRVTRGQSDAIVRVEREGEDDLRIAVNGGFMSVTEEGVIILAESAEFESEIDAAKAQSNADSDDPAIAAKGRAELRAIGKLD